MFFADFKAKGSVGEKSLSPTSTDSGILPDTEGQTVAAISTESEAKITENKQNKTSPNKNEFQSQDAKKTETENSYKNDVTNLPGLFSPRPSPITSPTMLPPLKEELKLIDKQGNQIKANLSPPIFQPSTYKNFTPAATVFTFSKPTTSNKPSIKRKRKMSHKARGPRPKTAALSSTRMQSDSQIVNNQSKSSTTLSFQTRLRANTPEVSGSSHPLEQNKINSYFGFNRHLRTFQPSNSSANESFSKKSSPEINFDKPPFFLSQSNKKPQLHLSLIERSPVADRKGDALPKHNLWCPSSMQEPISPPSALMYSPNYQNIEFSNRSTIVTPPASHVPAHSIEEAFESRNPRAFTLHRRQKLSPINDSFRGYHANR